MIQANELRKGSWIKDRGGKQWQVDCWEHPNKVAAKLPHIGELFGKPLYGHPLTEEVEYLEPIPLTPEILEKCGFEWETENKTHLFLRMPQQSMNKRRIDFYYNNGVCETLQMYMQDYLDGYFEILPPLYLHQLQNLFYALTGEELNYQP